MPKPSGKKFPFKSAKEIKTSFLEVLPYKGKTQLIKIETEELTAVCPFSGLPDFARLIVEYIPKSLIIELKSLKYYLVSFRDVGIYQENLTSRIYSDLYKILSPKVLKVTTIYRTRGGIDVTCQVDSSFAI